MNTKSPAPGGRDQYDDLGRVRSTETQETRDTRGTPAPAPARKLYQDEAEDKAAGNVAEEHREISSEEELDANNLVDDDSRDADLDLQR